MTDNSINLLAVTVLALIFFIITMVIIFLGAPGACEF